MNMNELIEMMGNQHRVKHDPSYPLPEAVADTLVERYNDLLRVVDLKPGDLVTFKTGFDGRPPERRGDPMMLLDISPVLMERPRESVMLRMNGLSDYSSPVPWMETAIVLVLDRDGDSRMTNVDIRWLDLWVSPSADV